MALGSKPIRILRHTGFSLAIPIGGREKRTEVLPCALVRVVFLSTNYECHTIRKCLKRFYIPSSLYIKCRPKKKQHCKTRFLAGGLDVS